ncbi:hypothetical protein FDN13_01675 [Caloramator sp. E03]|uniref:hypothetical protein n=1 Tax=Caloramator sp. E03 TaxID=2576307 RepID=UPI0011104D05|nr:hypothetical protein [Caloramator sp. E03]QCX32509.1 hypothetical protein FDN13_01675 [Caloramator sp. E03]
MKYHEYVNKIKQKEYDIEAGMLSQLEIEVPDELHGSIMKTIRNEKVRRRNLWYKTFSSIAAAILVFIISITGIKDTLKSPQKSENETVKSNIELNVSNSEIKDDSSHIKTNNIVAKENSNATSLVSEKQNNTTSNRAKTSKKTTKTTKTLIALDNKKVEKSVVSDVGSGNIYTITSEDSQSVQDNSNSDEALFSLQSTGTDSGVSKSSLFTTLIATSIPVDYIATVDKNQGSVLSFIYNNPNIVLIDTKNSIYRIQRQDFSVLYDMINSQSSMYSNTGISGINSYSQNKEYYFIKIVIK